MCVQERAVTIQILYQNGDCKELCNTLFSIFVFFNKIFMPSQPIFRTHTISPELSLFTTHASLPRGVRQHYYTLATLFSTSKSLCRYIYSYKPVAAITIIIRVRFNLLIYPLDGSLLNFSRGRANYNWTQICLESRSVQSIPYHRGGIPYNFKCFLWPAK